MAIKKINTDLELEAKLIDINASSGTNGQILSSTSTGITWIAPVTNNNQLTNGAGYATQTYVTTAVSNLVAAAPGTLDTLNELAAALGDDPNFATTVTNSIAGKLSLAGGTMTGDIIFNNQAEMNNYAVDYKNFNEYNSKEFTLKLDVGCVYIWPAWVETLITPNQSNSEKILYGFNI